MEQRLRERPYYESLSNPAAISSGGAGVEAIKLVHKGGFPIIVRAIYISYSNRVTNQEGVRIQLKDNANDVSIITEETIIGTIGFDRASAAPRIPLRIHPEVLIPSGNDLTLLVWTDVNIAARELSITLEGVIRF